MKTHSEELQKMLEKFKNQIDGLNKQCEQNALDKAK